MDSNVREGVLFASPASNDERQATASACVRKLGIQIPAVLDPIENGTERAYTGWPDRLYLIAKGGTIRYKSAPGPYGFSTEGLEKAIRQMAQD